MKIIAVVVTFNRLPLLKRTIGCLQQAEALDKIVVVNNGSTDGTHEWLDETAKSVSRLHVIHNANTGGAGGFATGMKRAYDLGAERIWCMDDDVFPRKGCLDALIAASHYPEAGIIVPRRIVEGEIFTTEFEEFDLTHTFAKTAIGHLKDRPVAEPTEISGAAFEGLFIKREVVEAIGYPNADLFIFYDDTDYCLRTRLAGFKIIYAPEALIDKYKFFTDASWLERTKAKRWKRFYQVRNGAWFHHHYGKTWGVRNLRSLNAMLGFMLPALVLGLTTSAYKAGDAWRFIRAWRSGRRERLGRIKGV
ncbi:MAG: glycosyltransferase [Bacteroidales bacterium]|nr:glycosyltransferase [Bacteroidales bacterium]